MSKTTIYDVSIPTFIRGMRTLAHLLAMAEVYANAKGIPIEDIPNWSLYENMKPLSFQVQVASNTAKKSVERLTVYQHAPQWADDEDSLPKLADRVAQTIDFLEKVDRVALDSPDPENVHLVLKDHEFNMSREDYLFKFAIPNFFFHVQTVYAILRMKGVEIGKQDYLGAFLGCCAS
ncbi:hypothetical protein B0H63DRAFT_434587 [Podospora didyma]|uniref:DUF1993 domain-containing protein n=1 Tax=Podospora didyma TaxID=330526 RepID=A0AAE0NGN4_9PEZI|nr:hypothetical protein B0H63DRAFT_434587 [Podospora didyma]